MEKWNRNRTRFCRHNVKLYSYLIVLALLLLCGCSSKVDGKGNKEVKISKFTDLIFKDNQLVPNKDFAWDIGTEEFLSKVYGADRLDPESDTFDEYHYSYSDETKITTFSPFIVYNIKGISNEASSGYAFDEQGLYASVYTWFFTENNVKNAENALEVLAEDFNSNPNMSEIAFQKPELSKEADRYEYEWSWIGDEENQYSIKLSAFFLVRNFIVEVDIRKIR